MTGYTTLHCIVLWSGRYTFAWAYLIQSAEISEILFCKVSVENFLKKFQKNLVVTYFTRGTNCQKGSSRGPPGAKRECPTQPQYLVAWDPPSWSTEGVRWMASAHLLPSTENQPQIFFPNFMKKYIFYDIYKEDKKCLVKGHFRATRQRHKPVQLPIVCCGKRRNPL